MSAQLEEAYGQGWIDAQQQIGAQLMAVLTRRPNLSRVQRRCQTCRQPMLIGEPAVQAGRDVFDNVLYRHDACPVPQAAPEAPVAPLTVVQDPQEPSASAREPQALLAVATGPHAGPWIITVNEPYGASHVARTELLHWRTFEAAAASRQLAILGYAIIPTAYGEDTIGGWSPRGNGCYTAPVIARPSRHQDPDDRLPTRIPGAALPQLPGLDTVPLGTPPDLEYIGEGQDPGSKVYRVKNGVCALDQGELHMTDTYDENGRVQTSTTTCQRCGSGIQL
jgi:hypothetical protein